MWNEISFWMGGTRLEFISWLADVVFLFLSGLYCNYICPCKQHINSLSLIVFVLHNITSLLCSTASHHHWFHFYHCSMTLTLSWCWNVLDIVYFSMSFFYIFYVKLSCNVYKLKSLKVIWGFVSTHTTVSIGIMATDQDNPSHIYKYLVFIKTCLHELFAASFAD